MKVILPIIVIFNIVSFLSYGASCFFTEKMKSEFRRYELPMLRITTGFIQILTSIMMAFGFYNPLYFTLSAFIFIVMMITAIFIRIRIKDSLLAMFPALFFLMINGVIISFFRI